MQQYYYSRGARPAGLWIVTIELLIEAWKRGETTVLLTDDYYQLWSPVQSEIEEFPH